MKIVSAGEILWDLIRGEEHLGGAPLNFAVNAHRLGHDVSLVSAVGNDQRGDRAIARIQSYGLLTEFVRRVPVATGTVDVSVDEAGEPDYVIHRPAAYDFLEPVDVEADWIYFGTLVQTDARARAAIEKMSASIPNRFYDVNLRKNSYSLDLVHELIAQATAVKMNEAEAAIIGQVKQRYVCVTRGARGCAVWIDGDYAEVDGEKIEVVNTVGAGDAFAAAFLDGIAKDWSAEEVGRNANRAASLVAKQPGAISE